MDANGMSHYEDIIAVINKHKETLKFDKELLAYKEGLEASLKVDKLLRLFNITPMNKDLYYSHYIRNIGPYAALVNFNDDDRKIAWSDDDRQPKNEWLYKLSFPEGAYIFNREYPVKTFKKFFDELKSYNPKYSDTINKTLYFSPENAFRIHEDFYKIFDKYKKMANDEIYSIKIRKLEEKIAQMEKELP